MAGVQVGVRNSSTWLQVPRGSGMALIVVSVLGFGVAAGIVLFGVAGRFDLPMFWAYLATLIVVCLLAFIRLLRRSPDLVQERFHPGKGERDPITALAAFVLFAAQYVVAGLDAGRYHWSGTMPVGLQIAGLAAAVAGLIFAFWAMDVNPFFSSAVRLQQDRGQRVIASGPYRFVRHPGYTGALVYVWCVSVALGSWWSLWPILVVTIAMIRRTVIEDNMLRRDLVGYAEYAQKTRYRLAPGLW